MIAPLLVTLTVKAAVIGTAGLAGSLLLTRRPVERVDILRATVCVLLALPLVTLMVPAWNLALLPASSAAEVAALPAGPAWQGEIGPVAGLSVSAAMPWPGPLQIAAIVWLLGSLAVVARLVAGVMTLDRWSGEGSAVTQPVWRAALARLAPRRTPRLIATTRLGGPVSWGVPPGTILLDSASLSDASAAEAILAHELAHLRRGDWVFLMLSRLMLAVFWFNPVVWMVHAALVARTEEAADAAAVAGMDRQTYAHALVRLASQPNLSSPAPWASTAMAGDIRLLKKRIACLMSEHTPRSRPFAVALAVAGLSLVATPLAALQVTQDPPAPPPVPAAPRAPAAPILALMPVPAPPAPPAPPRRLQDPPVPPAPPAPPATPRGTTPHYRVTSYEELSPRERAEVDRARASAETARQDAEAARITARSARVEAERARAEADVARAEAGRARAEAASARQQATAARREAARHMAEGADDMLAGAREMREEAARLEDPAYRADQIARNRARGEIVTDAELRALAPRLREQADAMERQAAEMRARAANMG